MAKVSSSFRTYPADIEGVVEREREIERQRYDYIHWKASPY